MEILAWATSAPAPVPPGDGRATAFRLPSLSLVLPFSHSATHKNTQEGPARRYRLLSRAWCFGFLCASPGLAHSIC